MINIYKGRKKSYKGTRKILLDEIIFITLQTELKYIVYEK